MSRGLGSKQRHVLEDVALSLVDDSKLSGWTSACGDKDDPAVRRARITLTRMGYIERSPGISAEVRVACQMPLLPIYLRWKQLNAKAVAGFPVTLEAIVGFRGGMLADEEGGRMSKRQRGHRDAWEPPLAIFFVSWLVETGQLARAHSAHARIAVPGSELFEARHAPDWCPTSRLAPSLS